MAGPLTSDLLLALYQVLELPMFPAQGNVYGDGMVATVHDVTGSVRAVPTLITAHLNTYIYPDVTLFTALQGLLQSWVALGTDEIALQQGSVGNVTGIETSTRGTREEIRKQVLVMVPYWRYHEEMQRRRSGTIEIIR